MEKKLITLVQCAEVIGVTYSRMAELARIGMVPVVRLGRQIRIDPDKLAAFIDQGGKPLPGGWRREAR